MGGRERRGEIFKRFAIKTIKTYREICRGLQLRFNRRNMFILQVPTFILNLLKNPVIPLQTTWRHTVHDDIKVWILSLKM